MKKPFVMLLIGFVLLDVAGGGRGCKDKRPDGGGGGRGVGIVRGTVEFHGLNCQEGQPDFNIPPCTGPYPGYKMDVFAEDGTTLVLTVMTNAKGGYQVDLLKGDYVIYTQDGPMADNRKKNAFTVTDGNVTNLDLSVSTGIQ